VTLLGYVSFSLVSAPFMVAAGLLVVAGVAKVRQPHGAQRVIEFLGLPLDIRGVQLLGAAEACLGVAAIVSGLRWVAIAVALAFACFAIVASWLLLSRADLPSCGCLGSLDTPPSLVHVVLSLLGVGAAGAAAIATPVRLDAYLGSLPLLGVPFLIAVGAGVAAAALAMAYVPVLMSSYTAGGHG
jgi:hypothetical protein